MAKVENSCIKLCTQVSIQHSKKPSQAFVLKVNNFLQENKVPVFIVHVKWDKEESDVTIEQEGVFKTSF